MAIDPHFALFERYWLGEASPEETVYLEGWMRAHPDRRAWYEQLRNGLFADTDTPLSSDEVQRRTSNVLRVIDANTVATSSVRHPSSIAELPSPSTSPHAIPRPLSVVSRRSRTLLFTTLGAVVGAVLLISTWYGGMHRVTSTLSAHQSTYSTGNGERATITLPDGSIVLLNVASRLEVPANYATGNRTIRLSGEAFFTTVHRTGQPFTVISGPSTTRVLGTRFVVRHYDTDSAAVVAVQDGKVAVGNTGVGSTVPGSSVPRSTVTGSTVLTANQEVIVHPTQAMAVQPASSARFRASQGLLVLNRVTLQDAIPDLNRWFNVDIKLGDASLGKRLLAGEYATGSVGSLAEVLELTFGLSVVRNGNILTLYSRN